MPRAAAKPPTKRKEVKKMKVEARNQEEMAAIFKQYGKPHEVISGVGNYTPYESDSENDVFDEAMYLLSRWGAKSATLIY